MPAKIFSDSLGDAHMDAQAHARLAPPFLTARNHPTHHRYESHQCRVLQG